MSINTFWKIVVKILGIWVVIESLILIPYYFSSIVMVFGDGFSSNLPIAFAVLTGIFFFYIMTLRLLLFKTNWIIQNLKLEEGFNEDRINFTLHRSVIIKIAIIIIGGFLLVDNLPTLFSQVYTYLQTEKIASGGVFNEARKSNSQGIILYSLKCLIGVWMLTNSRFIVNFLESRRKE